MVSIRSVKKILYAKGWTHRKRKSLSGSVYLHCYCGYKKLLIRVSDHPSNQQRFPKPDVDIYPDADDLNDLIKVLDSV